MAIKIVKDRFAGKTIILTGAGAGIGKACVERFAQEGAARIVAADWNSTRLEMLRSELRDYPIEAVAGDISLESTTQAILAAADGRADVLINNAGIMDGFLPVGEVDDATWEKVFAINVTAVMRLTRAVIPTMLKAQKGAIVNVTSEAGLRGSCAGAAYTMSKHALIGLTKNTSFMYADKGIRCNAVAPGAVKTSIEAPFNSQMASLRLGPLFQAIVPPVAEANQLAAAITWLASEDSPNITGAILASDGGWSAI